MRSLVRTLAVLAAVFGIADVGLAQKPVLQAGAFAQDARVEKGAKVFADQKCSLCNSVAGKGNAKGALDEVGSKLTAAEIHDWIVKPTEMAAKAKADRKPPMPTKYASGSSGSPAVARGAAVKCSGKPPVSRSQESARFSLRKKAASAPSGRRQPGGGTAAAAVKITFGWAELTTGAARYR